jgi:ActR/RegA family two-component response regulator
MKDLLICSSDPMFVKNIYGALRSEGFNLEVVERTAMAVQCTLRKSFDAAIIDPNAIGLSAVDAAEIIQRDGTPAVIAGYDGAGPGGLAGSRKPVDVMEIIDAVRDLGKSEAA